MMKRAMTVLVAAAVLAACQQAPVADAPAAGDAPGAVASKPQNYVALPGQAATSATPSETTTAFEFAAAAYAQSPEQALSSAELLPPRSPATTAPASALAPQAPPIPEPRPVPSTGLLQSASPGVAAVGKQPSSRSGDGAPYAVQITNGTPGRLFVEVQDDGGNIFPIGFMHAGQRIGSQPQEARAISGQLTIIVRDPDRPGAPELRRYRVAPPPHYEGKTLGVTVLPGGRYRVTLDGQVLYTSPEPAPAA